jgi:hypothetical protein
MKAYVSSKNKIKPAVKIIALLTLFVLAKHTLFIVSLIQMLNCLFTDNRSSSGSIRILS